jgi:hypothetical protein
MFAHLHAMRMACSTATTACNTAYVLAVQSNSLQVLVVGSASNQEQLKSWAVSAGLPNSCIITSSSCTGLLQGLAAAVAACPSVADCYVLAENASFVLEPGTSMSRLVEAAAVRGKDTVTCTVPFEDADLGQLVQVRGTAAQLCKSGTHTVAWHACSCLNGLLTSCQLRVLQAVWFAHASCCIDLPRLLQLVVPYFELKCHYDRQL